jgi:ABC-type branched-subunit amino acid transport system ATPase component/ABC-type branched-subunit amino acid transport system permease subunit
MSPVVGVLTFPFTNFELPLSIIILGAVTGLTYGLLAVGLSLIYKATRVLNFAHGALGALPGVLVPVLVLKQGWSYWIALPLALVVGVAGGALLEVAVIRRLRTAPRLIVMVATIAAAQILGVGVAVLPKGDEFLRNAYPTPFHGEITIGALHLGPGELMILAVAPVLALGLTLFLNFTRIGLGARASAENLDAALMTGIPVKQVSLVVWAVAGLFAAASAILVGATQPLSAQGAGLGASLLVRGLAGAMVGGLESLPLVFAGGVGIGVIELLVQWNYPSAGLLNPLLFGLILASLLLHRGLGAAARGGSTSSWSLAGDVRPLPEALAAHPRVRRARRIGMTILIAGTALAANIFSPSQRVLLSSVLLVAMMGLSLVVLTGYAGQISLGQYAFVALGALIGGRMAQLGFPPLSALLYAVAGAGVAAAAVGIPALRVRGLFLAVTTLAFALAAEGWLFKQDWLSGGSTSFSAVIPRPSLLGVDFGSEVRYSWLCLGLLVVTSAMVFRLRRTGIGRAMIAVRDNEPAAATLSLSPRRVKIVAFVLSGLIAGLAGYFYGGLLVNFGAALSGTQRSITLVVMVILGGVTSVTGAILGALWVQGIPYAFGTNAGLLSSALGVLVVLLVWPGGLASIAFRLRDRLVTMLTGQQVGAGRQSDQLLGRTRLEARPRPPVELDAPPALAASDILVRFGGNVALDHVSVHVQPGEILGLLGPNGAGKTTLFDVLSGQVRPTAGRVELFGEDITRLRPEERALLGLGRTFQQARLFDDLTVYESVQIGLERRDPSEVVPSVLALPPSWRAEKRKRQQAKEIVNLLGLGQFEGRRIIELSTGTRRLAELACVVAIGAEVILLDEPTAGIAQAEVEKFSPVIREIQQHLAATVVIVEHDVPLMMSLTERLYVLAAGQIIAEGPPEVIRNDQAVIEAYMGSDERMVNRSGARGAPRAAAVAGTTRTRRAAPLRADESTSGGRR